MWLANYVTLCITIFISHASVSSAEMLSREEILNSLQNSATLPSINETEIRRSLQNRISVEPAASGAVEVIPSAGPSVDLEIFFDYNSSVIEASALPQLVELGAALVDPEVRSSRFMIAGHTDASGGREYNMRLSEERALAVKEFLIRNFPLDPSRFVPIGVGEEQLKDPRFPEAAVNRRVQIVGLGQR